MALDRGLPAVARAPGAAPAAIAADRLECGVPISGAQGLPVPRGAPGRRSRDRPDRRRRREGSSSDKARRVLASGKRDTRLRPHCPC